MRKKLLGYVLFAAFVALACSPTRNGPTPIIESVAPAMVCTAQSNTTIQITGQKFSPAVTDTLTGDPAVLMPEVWLVSAEVEEMVPADNVTLTRGDGTSPDVLDVVIPAGMVAPRAETEPEASYQVKVVNPNDNSDVWDALVIEPPPCFETFDILGVDPPFGWTDAATTVTILSDNAFVSTPSVQLVASGDDEATPIELINEAFIDASTMTAQVPAGTPVGLYDVVVNNPPSARSYGTLIEGFEVVSEPIPSIANVNPNRGITNQHDPEITISGANFRDPVIVELIDETEQVAWSSGEIPPAVGGDTIPTSFPSQDLQGFYLVRVTNADQGTYTTYSGFVVTTNSANLEDPPAAEASMATGRRMLSGVLAQDPIDNRFLYAIGGDSGDGGEVLDTIELSQLSKFGVLGAWNEQKYTLNTPRVGAAATTVRVFDPAYSAFIPAKTYIYVTGGKDASGTVLDTVERALVLNPDDSPTITDIDTTAGAGLDAGTWYYKVSAVMAAGDADNPDGESLASDEATMTLDAAGSISLRWTIVPGAASYRIYRTDEVDGSSQAEHLIASDISGTSFTDTGEAAGTEPPLFTGSTSRFVTLAETLSQPKWGHAAHWAHDDSGNEFIYVLGGIDTTDTVLPDIEYAAIDTVGPGTKGHIGTFGVANVTPMNPARAFFGSVMEDTTNVTGFAENFSRLIVVGGILDLDNTTDDTQQFDISTGGGNTIFDPTGGNGNQPKSHTAAGLAALIFNEKLITAGGARNVSGLAYSNCLTTLRDIDFDYPGGYLGTSLNASGQAALVEPRAFAFAVPSVGFAYIVGGTGDGTNALSTTERLNYL